MESGNRFRQASNRFLGFLKCLQIRAQLTKAERRCVLVGAVHVLIATLSKYFSCTIEYRKGQSSLVQGFFTILRDASMQYITKLATSQSQTPPISPPPNYNIMYPKDAPLRKIKISSVHKILLKGPWA